MAQQTGQIVGRGVLFDRTNNFQFDNMVSLNLTSDVEIIELPQGDLVTDEIIEIVQKWSGRLEFRDLSADSLAGVFGASAAANTVKMVERESGTVPASPFTYTCSGAGGVDIAYTDAVQVTDSTGFKYQLVLVAPSASGEVQVSEDDLIFNSTEEGNTFEATYFVPVTGSGETVSVGPTDLPGLFELVAHFKSYDRYAGTYLTDGIGFRLKRCKRNGPMTLGASVGEIGNPMGFDFRIEVLSDADIEIFFPST
jgi:hypothetical protein